MKTSSFLECNNSWRHIIDHEQICWSHPNQQLSLQIARPTSMENEHCRDKLEEAYQYYLFIERKSKQWWCMQYIIQRHWRNEVKALRTNFSKARSQHGEAKRWKREKQLVSISPNYEEDIIPHVSFQSMIATWWTW